MTIDLSLALWLVLNLGMTLLNLLCAWNIQREWKRLGRAQRELLTDAERVDAMLDEVVAQRAAVAAMVSRQAKEILS